MCPAKAHWYQLDCSCCLKHGLMQSRLGLNSLYSWDWPCTPEPYAWCITNTWYMSWRCYTQMLNVQRGSLWKWLLGGEVMRVCSPMTPLVTFREEKVKTQLPCLFCRWMLPPMLACSNKAFNRLSGHHHHALESGANRLRFFFKYKLSNLRSFVTTTEANKGRSGPVDQQHDDWCKPQSTALDLVTLRDGRRGLSCSGWHAMGYHIRWRLLQSCPDELYWIASRCPFASWVYNPPHPHTPRGYLCVISLAVLDLDL